MGSTVHFDKTDKAWAILAMPGLIDRRAHDLLLLANGSRSERELSMLLGNDVSALAQGLLQQGYLQQAVQRGFADTESSGLCGGHS